MKALTVLLSVVGVVVADVGLGYQYKVPHTSYGVPYNQYASGSSNYNSNRGTAGQNYYQNYNAQALGGLHTSTGYQTSGAGTAGQNTGYQNSNYQSALPLQSGSQTTGYNYQSATPVQSVAGSNLYYQQQQQQPGNYQYQHQHNYQTASRYQQHYQQYYNQAQQQQAQVFKHFYVHAAPEEPEVPQFRQPPVLPPPQKHYKIIFIKTPTPPAPAPQYVPLQQQNEEKTIVYVLVKKPEEAGEIVVPKVEQKKPTKPEVYFIKYNSKEGSQGVINNIVADYNNGQVGTVYNENTATGTVDYAGQQDSGVVGGLNEIFGSNSGQSSSFSSGNNGLSAVNAEASSTSSFGTDQSSSSSNLGSSSVQSFNTNSVTGSDTTGVGNALVQSNFNGDSGNTFTGIGTSQGLPHETYGPPKFSLH